MTTLQMLAIARSHAHKGAMASSAQLCLSDAVRFFDAPGHEALVRAWLLRSLKYSVGIFHPDFAAVASAIGNEETS